MCDVIVLPDTVPCSAIVTDVNLSIKEKAYDLYQKYIGNESIYSINISFRVRLALNKYFENYDEWIGNDNIDDDEIMNIFDGCCSEIKRLMNDSFFRFKATSQYQQIVQNLLFIK